MWRMKPFSIHALVLSAKLMKKCSFIVAGTIPGTTTLLGGVLSKMHESNFWKLDLVSVGDCKAYLYKSTPRVVEDITLHNRSILNNPSDPGGRLGNYLPSLPIVITKGPYVDHAHPDYRNLCLRSCICEVGDLIVCVSDGVYDNLTPEHCGKEPRELAVRCDSWFDGEHAQKLHTVRWNFANERLKDIMTRDTGSLDPCVLSHAFTPFQRRPHHLLLSYLYCVIVGKTLKLCVHIWKATPRNGSQKIVLLILEKWIIQLRLVYELASLQL